LPRRAGGNLNSAMSEVVVHSGEVVAQRLIDVAYSVDLAAAERLWSAYLGSTVSRSRLTTAPAKALAFDVPPLLLTLQPVSLAIGGKALTAPASARIYDLGVIALSIHIPVADASWQSFSDTFNGAAYELGMESPCPLWRDMRARLLKIIEPALERPSAATLEEDYLLGVVHALEPALDAATLRERVDLVTLLSGESRGLSHGAQADLLQRSFSYFADDLVVLTWDRAFIYEPRGDSDVAGVIEVANAQLVEFRYYDELLDQELPQMYDRVEHARRTGSFLASRRFANLARKLYMLVAEVTELTEKVDNALQVTEDVYLARVYAAALDLFRVPKLSAAVDRKLAIIRDTYAALYEEASSQRAELLEVAIVLLIVIEIALAVFRR
jgi:hypothetical protein